MNRRTLLLSAAAMPLLATPLRAALHANPLLGEWADGVPPYDAIRPAHYRPAFAAAIAAARGEHRALTTARSEPTFANTIEAMERSGQQLARVSAAFFTVAGADATPEIQAIEEAVVPDLTRFSNETSLDPALDGVAARPERSARPTRDRGQQLQFHSPCAW